MKLAFNDQHLHAKINILAPVLNIGLDEQGIQVETVKEEQTNKSTITFKNDKAKITYCTETQLFRAISLLVQKLREEKNSFYFEETQHIGTIGTMLDCSRNAVLTVDAVKRLIKYFALMGINMVMLYTEDTYEIKERPYFGYMRGRYTQEELKQLDDYAYQFGIEMIPCIQTLGHMKMGLQWADTTDMRDGDDVLLIDEEKTYEMIRQMIRAGSAPFRSKRIHIGMDEAYQVGRGKHLDRFGYEERFTLMTRHLNHVLAITDELQLQPMIWSDMFFGSSFLQEHTEDSFVSEAMIERLPKRVQYVHWDYFSEDEATYIYSFQKHKKLGQMPIFAGGIWTWPSIAPNYGKTFKTTQAAMSASRKEGIDEVFVALWGDNGQETNLFAGLLGIQLYAEYGYSSSLEVNKEWLSTRFAVCTGGEAEAFYALTLLDEVPGVMKDNLKASNPSKFLLYQDILLPLFDADIKGILLHEHYTQLTQKLARYAEKEGQFCAIFQFYASLSQALSIKCDISINIKNIYDSGDKRAMQRLVERDLSLLYEYIAQAQSDHRELWFTYNKAFGWEVQDIRYGGVLARIQSTQLRLQNWIDGKVNTIEELEVERLNYLYPEEKEAGSIGRGHYYHRIVTASNFSG